MEQNRNTDTPANPDTQGDEFVRANRLFENESHEEALSSYLRLAETHRGRSIYTRIGWMYDLGKGTEKDARQADDWYQRAADAGIPAGYYYLASMRFWEGKHEEVRELMERAAAQDYSPALYHLGQMHMFGKGVPVDQVKAYKYYEQAAAQGHLFAQRVMTQKFIRGDYGIWSIFKGYFMLFRLCWTGFKLKLRNPSDDRLRRLA